MSAVLRGLLLAAFTALAACAPPQARYSGIDLTGADFGRDFKLTDANGRERALADFRGKYLMIFFGYTNCPDVCPTALARAVEVRKKLGAEGTRLQVIFVTVDPERDTPAVLNAYTHAFDAGFLGLRGDLARTREVANEFHVMYEKVPTGSSYAMDHTALTYIFDARGRLRLALRHSQTADEFATDIQTLIKSESNQPEEKS
jgi:protein SCO1